MRISDWSSDVCSSDLFAERDRSGGIFRPRSANASTGTSSRSEPRPENGPTHWTKTAQTNHRSNDVPAPAFWCATGSSTDELVEETTRFPCGQRRHVLENGRASCRERVCK